MNIVNIDKLKEAFESAPIAAPEMDSTAGGYLKIVHTTGAWIYGSDKQDVEGDELIVDIRQFKHGWVYQDDAGVYKNVEGSAFEAMPPIPASGADESRTIVGAFADGKPAIFNTKSMGGKRAWATLFDAVRNKVLTGAVDCFPVVQLESDMYFNKKHKTTIYNPKLTINGWVSSDGHPSNGDQLPKPPVEEEEEATEEAPKRRRRR